MPHVGSWRDKFFKEREGKYRVEQKEENNELKQAKVLGKKINITDQAIDKVRYVDIPTHTKKKIILYKNNIKNYLEMLKKTMIVMKLFIC